MAERQPFPWHDCPRCPDERCGAPCGSLEPYNPDKWYGPRDATLFCPACGTGWHGTDAELEQALVAETAWNAYQNSTGMTEEEFARSEGWRP